MRSLLRDLMTEAVRGFDVNVGAALETVSVLEAEPVSEGLSPELPIAAAQAETLEPTPLPLGEVEQDAVLISVQGYLDQPKSRKPRRNYPRIRYNKLSFLYGMLTRNSRLLSMFGQHHFDPYSSSLRYKGHEAAALAAGYLEQVSDTDFVLGPNTARALELAHEHLDWAALEAVSEAFREVSDEVLELYTTVAYTARALSEQGQAVNAVSVWDSWSQNKVWRYKRDRFTLSEVLDALKDLRRNFLDREA